MKGDEPMEPAVEVGEEVEIVKLAPDGHKAASYSGTLLESPPGWVVAKATWTFRRMELGYMTFDPGDYLYEYFSTVYPFNAFVLFSPEDDFKGWYCNITHPTTVKDRTVFWHDLYVDIIQKADGEILILDEDELEQSGLARSDPDLHAMILETRDLVVAKMRQQRYPFSDIAGPDG
jgi:hypothetical protein